ncbi:MAG: type II toxin-antitoxin system death-on-curing family toxin [Thermoanaerobaculia bacterium]
MTLPSVRFLSVDDVLAIHENTIAREGGLGGLRDAGLLESAVLMPQQQFGGEYLHPDLPAMAAAYLFHIAQNHAFHDGNKRTAALATLVFLSLNDVESLPTPEALERTTLAVAASEVGKSELTEWMGTQID